MRIRIDESLCIGSTQCTFTAPAVFAMDSEGCPR
jgi:ferredoxin